MSKFIIFCLLTLGSLQRSWSNETVRYLPHFTYSQGLWNTELSICNPTAEDQWLTILAYDNSGQFQGEYEALIAAFQSFQGTVYELAPGLQTTVGWLEVRTADHLPGLMKFTYSATGATSSLPLISEMGSRLILPLLAQDDAWDSGFAVTNMSENDQVLQLDLKDKFGTIWQSTTVTLGPKAKWVSMLEAAFGLPLPQKGILEVRGDEAIMGFALSFDKQLRQVVAVPGEYMPALDSSVESYRYRVPRQTGDGWQTTSLTEVGIDRDRVEGMWRDLMMRQDHRVHGLVVARHGKLVFEGYRSGRQFDSSSSELAVDGQINYYHVEFDRNTPHLLASATKSVTSALVGIALDQKLIDSVDDAMFSFFPDYSFLNDAAKSQINIQHMLTMTTGQPWDDGSYPIEDERNDENRLIFNEDPVGFALGLPVLTTPGTAFDYNSSTTVLLGEIVKRSSGMSLVEFADQNLFAPLGITNYFWAPYMNANDVAQAAGGLYMLPRDMAKFGQLYLQEGTWNGTRIISQDWIRESTRNRMNLLENNMLVYFTKSYGYQWWLGVMPTSGVEGYIAAGWGGQYIMVFPKRDLVIALTQGDYEFETPFLFYEMVDEVILSAISD